MPTYLVDFAVALPDGVMDNAAWEAAMVACGALTVRERVERARIGAQRG